jgi:hypothetical protein
MEALIPLEIKYTGLYKQVYYNIPRNKHLSETRHWSLNLKLLIPHINMCKLGEFLIEET